MKNLEDALERIRQLEEENKRLSEELEFYRNRKLSGRKKHDAKWMDSYNKFCALYQDGLSMSEIAERSEFSRRTAYRFKAYFEKWNESNSK